MHKAVAEEARSQHRTLEKILDHEYTTKLSSAISTNITDARQTLDSGGFTDESEQDVGSELSLQFDNISSISHESTNHVEFESIDNVNPSAQTDTESLMSSQSHCMEDLLVDSFDDSRSDITRQESSPYTGILDFGSSEDDDDAGSGSDNDESFEFPPISQVSQQVRQADEGHGGATNDDVLLQNMGQKHGSGAYTPGEAQFADRIARSAGDGSGSTSKAYMEDSATRKIADKGKGRAKDCCLSELPGYILQDPYFNWTPEPGPGGPDHVILRPQNTNPPEYGADSSSDLEEPLAAPPEVPTAAHMEAVAQLPLSECIRLINEFLQQNAAKIDTFRTRLRTYKATDNSSNDSRSTKIMFCSAWDDQSELILLTNAVLWIDALLSPFRTDILAEDLNNLRPRLQDAVHNLQAIRNPSRASTERPLTEEESAVAGQFSDYIVDIQASNLRRRQLLEHTSIDVPTFENLLQSAEIIRHRQDLDREYGQRNDLIDGLRRIYSTIVCPIPVCLSEHDQINQPAQPAKAQYGSGPFDPYKLPDRPELFDHISTNATRISSQGYTGIQFSEKQTPLSERHWHSMRQEMVATITAQQEDDVGAAKLRKNAQSMNKDWTAFYEAIFGGDRQKYVNAAAQRIETEEQEKAMKKMAEEYEGSREKEEEESEANTKAAGKVYQFRQSSVEEDQQADIGSSSTVSAQNSPYLSDCTEFSETTIMLDVGNQDDKGHKRLGLFCLNVNRPGGCPNRSRCGYESHGNEGKHCKDEGRCSRKEKCAFVHASFSSTGPSHSTESRSTGCNSQVDPRRIDLRPILEQALADPRTYRPCIFVNKHDGCKPKQSAACSFNHTLKGVVCQDFQPGHCPRGYQCPLAHAGKNTSVADPSPYMEKQQPDDDGNAGASEEGFRWPPLPSQQQLFENYPMPEDVQGLGIELSGQQPYASPAQPLNRNLPPSVAQRSQYQAFEDYGLHPNPPNGPRSQYIQPPESYTLPDRGGNNSRSYNNESRNKKRKHGEAEDLDQGLVKRGAPLHYRITRDPNYHEGRNYEPELKHSDGFWDDENDADASQGTGGPRKRQKNKKWNGQGRHGGRDQRSRRGR